jgi:hypothetical protein
VIEKENEKTLRPEKERRVFPFWEGFETSVSQIPQPETAFQAPAQFLSQGGVHKTE